MSIVSDSPFLSRAPAPGLECNWRRVEGIFDAAVAQELAASLGNGDFEADLHLDFSRASRVEDRGLAALAASLTASGLAARVVFHGLSRHHIRLLAYFGVDADRNPAAALQ